MPTNHVNAYIKYKAKRAEIKARQRLELERELEPFLRVVGEEINAAQGEGKTIQEIEHDIGAKNRTLIYSAKKLAKEQPQLVVHEFMPEGSIVKTEDEPVQRWYVADISHIEGIPCFVAYIDGAHVGSIQVDDDGELEIPEEWSLDTGNQKLYREIIQYVKNELQT